MLEVIGRDVDRTLALVGAPRIDRVDASSLLTNRLVG